MNVSRVTIPAATEWRAPSARVEDQKEANLSASLPPYPSWKIFCSDPDLQEPGFGEGLEVEGSRCQIARWPERGRVGLPRDEQPQRNGGRTSSEDYGGAWVQQSSAEDTNRISPIDMTQQEPAVARRGAAAGALSSDEGLPAVTRIILGRRRAIPPHSTPPHISTLILHNFGR